MQDGVGFGVLLGQMQNSVLGHLKARKRELYTIDPREARVLQVDLEHHLADPHSKVDQRATCLCVQVLGVKGTVHPAWEELAVQQRTPHRPCQVAIVLGQAEVARRPMPRLLDFVPVHPVHDALRAHVVRRHLLAEHPRLVVQRGQHAVHPAAGVAGVFALALLRGGPLNDIEGGLEHIEPPLLLGRFELNAMLARFVVLRHEAVLPVTVVEQHRDAAPHQRFVRPGGLALHVKQELVVVMRGEAALVTHEARRV
mmetsp:Transcript_82959/g.234335  ORF Transcript_82959/g.234335 Transcript_82959/m.234335 type:complete len:255 (-) Transcript_82959:138-902(-)